MLSYSKDNPWYTHTHPDVKDHNFDEEADLHTMTPKFDYYDIENFKHRIHKPKSKSLGILHTNICSLQANIDQLEDLLHDMKYNFDIIALSETWNPESTKKNFSPKQLEGYLDYHGTTGTSKKGGCGFYIKNNFTPIPRNDLEFKIKEPGCETETCWVELINEKGPNTIVGVMYRHPSRNNQLFQVKLKQVLKQLNKEKKKTILCGDFNLNLLNYENDKQVSSFLSCMLQSDFHPCIIEPTRITNTNKPSLVDNIFINTFDDPLCGNILEHISYDHLPNFIIIDHDHTNKIRKKKKRDKRNFDPAKFQKELLNDGQLLLELLTETNAEAAMKLYLDRFLTLLDKHCPLRNLSKKETKTALNPWITKGLLISIKRKGTYLKSSKKKNLKTKKAIHILNTKTATTL